ncbi:MAG: hypothetical protein WCH31_01120 [Actinomycetes bacterium]
MSLRLRLSLLVPLAAAFAALPAAHVWAATTKGAEVKPSNASLIAGKKGYRQFCGKCHALDAALAAGFGGTGLGQDGGPSFNDLRVSANLSIVAVTEQFGGHEYVVKKMTWQQIHDVANFVQVATKQNVYRAHVWDG